jgi:hypothetical protein
VCLGLYLHISRHLLHASTSLSLPLTNLPVSAEICLPQPDYLLLPIIANICLLLYACLYLPAFSLLKLHSSLPLPVWLPAFDCLPWPVSNLFACINCHILLASSCKATQDKTHGQGKAHKKGKAREGT